MTESIQIAFAEWGFREHYLKLVIVKTYNNAKLAKELRMQTNDLVPDCASAWYFLQVHFTISGQSPGKQ